MKLSPIMVFALSLVSLSFLFFPCVCKSVLHNSLHQYFITFLACTVGHHFSHTPLGYSAKSSTNTSSLNEKQKLRSPTPLTATSFGTCMRCFKMKTIGFHFETLRNSAKLPAFSYQHTLRTSQLALIKLRETPISCRNRWLPSGTFMNQGSLRIHRNS